MSLVQSRSGSILQRLQTATSLMLLKILVRLSMI